MIVLDLETSGIDTSKCGIWQIGAIELENPENYFLEEGRIDDEDDIVGEALIVTGKSEEELRDNEKKSQKQLIESFLKWVESCGNRIVVGQNIGWDLNFMQNKCLKYNLRENFEKALGVKGFDLYALAELKHLELNGTYRLKENGRGSFPLPAVLSFCGLENPRVEVQGSEVIKSGKPHNALEDCKLEGECFSRLMYGKNLFPEFSESKVPEYLKKVNNKIFRED